MPGTVLSIGIQHWKKKRQSLAPTELIHNEAKTVNRQFLIVVSAVKIMMEVI